MKEEKTQETQENKIKKNDSSEAEFSQNLKIFLLHEYVLQSTKSSFVLLILRTLRNCGKC